MNPLTNVRNIKALNEQDLKKGIFDHRHTWHSQYKDSAYLFVGGLPYDLSEGDIICVFSQYGEIVHINLVRDKKTGKSQGYGFLCYEDQRSSILAVDNLNSVKLGGRTIRVDHVLNYRAPKSDEKDEDGNYKLKEVKSCAPKTPSPPPTESGKRKKRKKEKKKKKKKEESESDDSDHDNRDMKREIPSRKSESKWDKTSADETDDRRSNSNSRPVKHFLDSDKEEYKRHKSSNDNKKHVYRDDDRESSSTKHGASKRRHDSSSGDDGEDGQSSEEPPTKYNQTSKSDHRQEYVDGLSKEQVRTSDSPQTNDDFTSVPPTTSHTSVSEKVKKKKKGDGGNMKLGKLKFKKK